MQVSIVQGKSLRNRKGRGEKGGAANTQENSGLRGASKGWWIWQTKGGESFETFTHEYGPGVGTGGGAGTRWECCVVLYV